MLFTTLLASRGVRFAAIAILLLNMLACASIPRARADAPGPFAWGETTRVADAGWGRMIHLRGARWLCVVSLYPHPHSILRLQISADNARTWTPVATVAEPGRDLDNGDLLLMPDHSLRLTGRSVVGERARGADAVRSYHLPVYASRDGGKTWTFQSEVDSSDPSPRLPDQPSVGLWEPFLFLLANGSLACAYADETHAQEKPSYSQIVGERVSGDGGKTWGREIVLAAQTGGGGQRPGMPVVTRLRSGGYFAVYEVVGLGDADVHGKASEDGIHWPLGIGTLIPGQHAGPWVTTLQDGRLLVTSCENQISVSGDKGTTWQTASPPPWPIGHVLCWPALYQTGPNEIAAMVTWHGVQIRRGRIVPLGGGKEGIKESHPLPASSFSRGRSRKQEMLCLLLRRKEVVPGLLLRSKASELLLLPFKKGEAGRG